MPAPALWPSPGDYNAAIQNPQNCFNDPELKKGKPQTNQFGIPIGLSGNFAIVYQLHCGGRSFAVRCFIRPVTDQQERYSALSQHLSAFSLPTLVDFAYLPHGIRMSGQWYPVVRMEWISGKQLHRHVEDNLRQSEVLERLAAQWRGVVAGLYGAHTAHGDLQHGNILVDGHGQIRLVDYDGFFLPALRRRPPGEVGHPNYQHPERIQKGYYEENADAFSALVIYLSLLALRVDPSLWKFHNGENLIFLADDFKTPGRTPLWGHLKRSSDSEVRRLTSELEHFCRRPVSAVQDLEAILQQLPRAGVPLQGVPASSPPHAPEPTAPLPAPMPVPQPTSPPPATPPTATVTCPKCGKGTEASRIYCQHCAHQLCGDRWCPYGPHRIPVKAQFCPKCGRKLQVL